MGISEPLRVATLNLRFDCPGDLHPWQARRTRVATLLTDVAPHLLGTQEGLRHQLDDLTAALPGHYRWVGSPRGQEESDEYNAVFYDSRRLGAVGVTQRWLSKTPDVPGSLSWGACPRIFTAVEFVDLLTGARLLAVNTHLDHVSARARLYGASLICAYVAGRGNDVPAVVLGDFNTAAHHSAVSHRMRSHELVDVFTACPGSVDRPTFTDYAEPARHGPRIDWILTSPDVGVCSAQVHTERVGGQFVSDHLLVEAVLRLPAPPGTAGLGGTAA